MSLTEGVQFRPMPQQPQGPALQGPQDAGQGATGVMNGQPVQTVAPDTQLVQQAPQQAPQGLGQPLQQAQALPLAPAQQKVADGILPTSDELKHTIGKDPKEDINLGLFKITRSNHYKAVVKELDAVNQAITNANTSPASTTTAFNPIMRNELGRVSAALEKLDKALEDYGDSKRSHHKQPMAQLRQAVQHQLQLLKQLDDHLADDKPWPEDLDVHTALQYLRAHPKITLEEMGVAARHGLGESEVAAYAKSGMPLREGTLPGQAKLQGQLSELGHGATATVFKGPFKLANGSTIEGVFKAEKPPKSLPEAARHIGIDPKQPNFAARSVATFKLDQKLGLGLVPHTEIVLHDGQLGTVMGLAKGRSPLHSGDFTLKLLPHQVELYRNNPGLLKELCQHYRWADAKIDGDGLRVINSIQQEEADGKGGSYMTTVNKDSVVLFDMRDPNLRRELTKLQWLDALTGQVDRHAHNYFVHRGEDGKMHVTAIDNDMAFGKNTVHANDVNSAPFRGTPNIGGNALNGAKLPEVIDRATRDALMKLKPQDIHALLDGMLSPEEVQATIGRLDDIQTHIAQLDGSGRVFDFDMQWTTSEADDWLGVPHMGKLDSDIKTSGEKFSEYIPAVSKAMSHACDTSYVARDQLTIHLAATQDYKPAVFAEMMK